MLILAGNNELTAFRNGDWKTLTPVYPSKTVISIQHNRDNFWRFTDYDGDGLHDLVMLHHKGWLCFWPREHSGEQLVLKPGQRVLCDEKGEPLRLNPGSGGKSGRRKLHAPRIVAKVPMESCPTYFCLSPYSSRNMDSPFGRSKHASQSTSVLQQVPATSCRLSEMMRSTVSDFLCLNRRVVVSAPGRSTVKSGDANGATNEISLPVRLIVVRSLAAQ